MRPILVEIPSKLLFAAALVLAVVSFVRDRLLRKRDPKLPRSSTPLYLLGGALVLMGNRGGGWVPSGEIFAKAWLPVPIYAYGVMLGTSMIIGWFLAMRLAKNDGIPQDQAATIYMWTAVWSIVGARVLYIIVNFAEFDSAVDVFKVWKGGLVAYGGMIGGFLASWYNCHKRKIHLLRWGDASVPSVALGTAITRIGCLLFGCDYGRTTSLPWGISFPAHSPAWKDHLALQWIKPEATSSLAVHPTQMYEMLAGLSIFALLMFVRRVRRFSGQVFVTWVMGYGILRPIIEIFRDDDQRGGIGPLSTSQIIGITATLLGFGLLVALIRRYRADPTSVRLWEMPLEATASAGAGRGSTGGGGGGRKRKHR